MGDTSVATRRPRSRKSVPVAETAIEPLIVPPKEAARLISRSLASFYRDLAAGRIGPRPLKIGGSIRFDLQQLREWVAAGLPNREQWDATRAKKR